MGKNINIQALRTAARREQVLEAATKVFAEKGFHKATIKQIAGEAGVADGTIYNYFADKTDLLLGLLDRINETTQRQAHFMEAGEGDFETFFRTYLEHRMSVLKDNLALFQAILPEVMVNGPLRERYYQTIVAPTYGVAEDYFKALQANGTIKPLNTQLLMRVISSTLLGLLISSLLGDEAVNEAWEQLPTVISEIVLRGLLPEEIR